MPEDEREAVRQALLECGSLEALIRRLALSESEEGRKRRQAIEHSGDHPSDEQLYQYVLGWLKHDQEDEILDHLLLCRVCLEEVFRIRRIENATRSHVLSFANHRSWLDRLKGFVSSLSFPVMIQTPALEAVRGPMNKEAIRVVKIGDPLRLYVQPPERGHVTVFHYSKKGGEAKLVFPDRASDVTKVDATRELRILQGEVEGPAGQQVFKIIWTREQLIDPTSLDWDDGDAVEQTVENFFTNLEELEVDKDWQETYCVYLVTDA